MANEFIQKDYGGGAVATTLNGAISGSAASIVLTSGTSYPDGSAGPFVICIARGTGTEEKVIITSRAGNTLTVLGGAAGRGYDGSTGQAQVDLATVEHVMDAYSIKQANTFVNTPTTRGDIVFRNGSGNPQRLPVGAAGTVLLGGTDPAYGQVPTTAITDLAVTTGKLADQAVTSAKIADLTIVNGDVAAAAAIAVSKLATGTDGDTLGIYGTVPTWSPGYTTGTEGLRPTGREGMLYWATDMNRLWYYDGTGWSIKIEPWQSYTPTLTNVTIGNGTISAIYMRNDLTCEVRVTVTLGTTSSVTGLIGISVPSGTEAFAATYPLSDSGRLTAGGTSSRPTLFLGATNRIDVYATGTAGTYGTFSATAATVPGTWATTNVIEVSARWRMNTSYF